MLLGVLFYFSKNRLKISQETLKFDNIPSIRYRIIWSHHVPNVKQHIRLYYFRPNQDLSNKSIKQIINSGRIVLIGYWTYSTAYYDVASATKEWFICWTKTSRHHSQIGVAIFASFRQEKPWRSVTTPSPIFLIVSLSMRH